jgi:lipopolysaccharide export LptBFGC system permease protein LptF
MDEKNLDLVSRGWGKILKALPFDDGPSSTRMVYLLSAVAVCLVLVMMGAAFALVYWRNHIADVVMAGAIAATITALFGFASNSQNNKNRISAGDGKEYDRGDMPHGGK